MLFSNAVIISPHADDAELWAGGSISKWRREGKEVSNVILSAPPERIREAGDAASALDMRFYLYDYPDTMLAKHDEAIRGLLMDFDYADLVIIPSGKDRHQDHRAVHRIAMTVFRFSTVLTFDLPYNGSVNPNFFVPLTRQDVDKKIEACQCYKSQSHQTYMKPENIEALARVRGTTLRTEFAEAFEVVRWID